MQQYIFIAHVEDKPGVLNRVASMFRRRNFNIESLAVGSTEKPEISRMTVVVNCPNGDHDAARIESNLYKLVNVIDVQDVTHRPAVTRGLALIKVKTGEKNRTEISSLATGLEGRIVDSAEESMVVEITGTDEKIHSLVEALRLYGILEMVQTGQISMTRGSVSGIRRSPGTNGSMHHSAE